MPGIAEPRYMGNGDYKSVLKWLRKVGAVVTRAGGAIAGGMSGFARRGPAGIIDGARAGFEEGKRLSRLVGLGDYHVETNSLVDGTNNLLLDVNPNNETGDLEFFHRELVGNIYASNTGAGGSPFQLTAFELNPGVMQTFPYLSSLATNFELYQFEGLVFTYKPACSDSNATSNSLGKVLLATNYDPDRPAFQNSLEMAHSAYVVSCRPSDGAVHGIETDPKQMVNKMSYVRVGFSTKDKYLTDIGTFYVGTEGIPFAGAGESLLGELWVAYKVILSRPRLYGSLFGNENQTFFGVGTTSAAAFLGDITASTGNMEITVASLSGTTARIYFPSKVESGDFLIRVSCYDNVNHVPQTIDFSAATGFSHSLSKAGPNMYAGALTGQSSTPDVLGALNDHVSALLCLRIDCPGETQATVTVRISGALAGTGTYSLQVVQIPSAMHYA